MKISVVCCDDSPEKNSRIVEVQVDSATIDQRVLDTIEQELPADEAKGLHNAAHHAEHGPVTYLQTVNTGGFSVLVGKPEDLQQSFFAAGSSVAFIDDQGPGHASKVGPDGVQRTLRILNGHIAID